MSEDDHAQVPPAQDPEVKQEDNSPINIKVVTQQGDEVFFKIKRSTKLSKLQGAYANKVGKDVQSIRFLYDGERINEEDTPASLEMDDGDTIDVMVEQVGGARCNSGTAVIEGSQLATAVMEWIEPPLFYSAYTWMCRGCVCHCFLYINIGPSPSKSVKIGVLTSAHPSHTIPMLDNITNSPLPISTQSTALLKINTMANVSDLLQTSCASPSVDLTNGVPPEILSNIFLIYGISTQYDSYTNHLILPEHAPLFCSSVSSRWRAIALSTPALWTYCDLSDLHPELMQLFLDRACNLPQEMYTVSHVTDSWTLNQLPIFLRNLDKFKALNICLDHEADEDEIQDKIGADEAYVYGPDINQHLRTLQFPLPYNEGKKAEWLASAYIQIHGKNDIHNYCKWLWAASIVDSAPDLHSLELKIPHYPLHWTPCSQLQTLSITTDKGQPIDDILHILSILHNLKHLEANIANAVPLQNNPTRIQNLRLPNIHSIILRNYRVLPALCILYSSIASAPNLDELIVKSSYFWNHEQFVTQILDRLPVPIMTLELDVRELTQSHVLQYLSHKKVGPFLKRLLLEGHAERGAFMGDEFLRYLTLTPDRRHSVKLEDLTLKHCLHATDGLLADMIQSRLDTTKAESDTPDHDTAESPKMSLSLLTDFGMVAHRSQLQDLRRLKEYKERYPQAFTTCDWYAYLKGWRFGRPVSLMTWSSARLAGFQIMDYVNVNLELER